MSSAMQLLAKVQVVGECWIWTGATDGQKRYGVVNHDGRTQLVHRVSYQVFVGPIPDGLVIDHVRDRGCTSKLCIRPAHLEPVPTGVNTRRSPEAPATINAAKTHCPQRHEYTEENTYTDKRGKRSCRTCQRDRMARLWHKNHPV